MNLFVCSFEEFVFIASFRGWGFLLVGYRAAPALANCGTIATEPGETALNMYRRTGAYQDIPQKMWPKLCCGSVTKCILNLWMGYRDLHSSEHNCVTVQCYWCEFLRSAFSSSSQLAASRVMWSSWKYSAPPHVGRGAPESREHANEHHKHSNNIFLTINKTRFDKE